MDCKAGNMQLNTSGSPEYWHLDGRLHRIDGPAIHTVDGENHWYKYGKRHRTDGPAVEYSNDDKAWFLFGDDYDLDDWLNKNDTLSEEEKVLLKLKYG
jgi:hypothetical protein